MCSRAAAPSGASRRRSPRRTERPMTTTAPPYHWTGTTWPSGHTGMTTGPPALARHISIAEPGASGASRPSSRPPMARPSTHLARPCPCKAARCWRAREGTTRGASTLARRTSTRAAGPAGAYRQSSPPLTARRRTCLAWRFPSAATRPWWARMTTAMSAPTLARPMSLPAAGASGASRPS